VSSFAVGTTVIAIVYDLPKHWFDKQQALSENVIKSKYYYKFCIPEQ